ncbi:coenzyme F420 biosynthesis-associated protein [Actinobacteria bacterium YIM 96077]|uniref:Coenzyme F420 biosynthesis-associated protein n=1 Tax=Phytoactinopolyspora halophila TaxID=1981511 RepID=A0A329QI67_9ACTN|nr:zinc-dependent metalloprotease [Phytoactinopolyspora halophila]AYY14668.1 coenzyme F420 biosynthesis-associated protein [Actinobacteria bacterium YIM 96077]RAW11621.1 coenzyme F420 biosynthesis-associated protein [Phytoactinopolyspora halophila]
MTMSDAEPELVDWDLADRTAKRLMSSGPSVTESEARRVVSELRGFAADAEGHVREVTGLDGSVGTAPVVIVDRGGWVAANTQSLRSVIAPLSRKIHQNRQERGGWPFDQVGPKATGMETGAFLAFVASRVLGQFDPFWVASGDDAGTSAGEHRGRLLLVAPNVVQVEQELAVVPRDFRLWVCLHEETHRVQFTAVPWLREHLASEIEQFVDATQLDSGILAANVRDIVRALIEAARGERNGVNILDVIQSPEQRAIVKRVTALMSLLEGHADVVMDQVGPQIIPTVETIRRRFQRRRRGSSGFDRAARKVLGLEAKMRQYRDGAKFVDEVVQQVGMAGFNRVWESPETLPTPDEIGDSAAWVRRVHGGRSRGAGEPQ